MQNCSEARFKLWNLSVQTSDDAIIMKMLLGPLKGDCDQICDVGINCSSLTFVSRSRLLEVLTGTLTPYDVLRP